VETKDDIIVHCFHCGEECKEEAQKFEQHTFCCQGCKLVYEILSENDLHSYYKYNSSPGFSPKKDQRPDRFGFLDDISVKSKLQQFSDGKTALVTFYIPQMHCSSCIWLLENLNSLIPAVIRSQVNFVKRSLSVTYQENKLSLRELVLVLSKVGYEPHLDMTDLEGRGKEKKDRSVTFRIGVSGFLFGNIMLFSFPEYFSLSDQIDPGFNKVFSYLNLALSIPVISYCSFPFFHRAWNSIQQKFLNIDFPIAVGIAVMFVRSLVEIISGIGPGFLDTMAGLIFFMLVGRAFQDKTYKTISFERNYKSFFPISVMIRKQGKGEEVSVPVSELEPEDHAIIRNHELVPADAILLKGKAHIDYSFVTGESALHEKKAGDLIYAGGRQVGEAVELRIVRGVSQSYLTQLWNQDVFTEPSSKHSFQDLVNRISHYFTITILFIAISGWLFWLAEGDVSKAWSAFTAVLIIACPCALAISSPFTLGNIIRIFGRRKFYLKNVSVIEKLSKIDTIVFDKTGTLTQRDSSSVNFIGTPLSDEEASMISTLVKQSSHPLSIIIYNNLDQKSNLILDKFMEVPGAGLEAEIHNVKLKIGSKIFVNSSSPDDPLNRSRVYVSFDGTLRGYFELANKYRPGISQLVDSLKKSKFKLEILSGDNDGEKNYLESIFGSETSFRFDQSPLNKLEAIRDLQSRGRKVLMVGDGLNDAGAIKQSDVGISVSDDVNNFSPASDGILSAESFCKLNRFLSLAKKSQKIIIVSFCISLLYNIIGLYFALQGNLSPLFAAILMPISSVSIIVFTSGITNLIAHSKKYKL
jgi:Cu+-exporting ATPase